MEWMFLGGLAGFVAKLYLDIRQLECRIEELESRISNLYGRVL